MAMLNYHRVVRTDVRKKKKEKTQLDILVNCSASVEQAKKYKHVMIHDLSFIT